MLNQNTHISSLVTNLKTQGSIMLTGKQIHAAFPSKDKLKALKEFAENNSASFSAIGRTIEITGHQ